ARAGGRHAVPSRRLPRLPRHVDRPGNRHGRAPRRVPESGHGPAAGAVRPRPRRGRRAARRAADSAARGAAHEGRRERARRRRRRRRGTAAGRARRASRRLLAGTRRARRRRARDRRRPAARATGSAGRDRGGGPRRGTRAVTPRFFIDRPVFAWVISLTILLAGVIALRALPIEQYPSIAPPSLTIDAIYPGADAAVLEGSVTQVIEQELNGVDGFLYMSSSSRANGTASINVTFTAGTDIDAAQVDVQNRLRSVEPRLPEEVRQQGVQVNEASEGFLMIIAITSSTGARSSLELGNFASTRVVDELR